MSDAPAARIAAALARLRLGRRGGEGPFGRPPGFEGRRPDGAAPFPGADGRGPFAHGHGHPHGPHGDHPHGPFGRSVARMRLLEVLVSADAPLSVGQIAERLGVDQPRASRLVTAVVETGHARREADPDDARRTLIVLTDEGRSLATRTRGARADAVEEALGGFTDAEREQLAALLTRLADAWPQRPPTP
ncbi:MarR family winged helix-turn-helix transcriptional regulator [Microbacterium gilvum]|uniref:HTH marR-type domain-containing protein n=1 Tax=Microbacterium gilvum TaxID=1336204 RepID=A0ABP9A0M9_9MICO